MNNIRIKICGLTCEADALAAVEAGVDAVGLVFYPPSPRCVSRDVAAHIVRVLPPFIEVVGLFVNASDDDVNQTLAAVPINTLQFHGDETREQCRRYHRPYIKAIRMSPDINLLEYANRYPCARAILLDAYTMQYGGAGKTFDWAQIPSEFKRHYVLSGGLSAANVAEAIRLLRPVAVDVSSGVESSPGIKDVGKMVEFITEVRHAVV